jgi:hypothetical protein
MLYMFAGALFQRCTVVALHVITKHCQELQLRKLLQSLKTRPPFFRATRDSFSSCVSLVKSSCESVGQVSTLRFTSLCDRAANSSELARDVKWKLSRLVGRSPKNDVGKGD